ncbi:lipoate--protein ligase family protein [Tautonia rosea]|uniref:lipoate--protein ligase family protein n=1 Tax=Tautonia rosea TaxID=2728037 RepID=UPI00147477C2|nr:lipoate--protein ligase family protein [Tautonia rosea]
MTDDDLPSFRMLDCTLSGVFANLALDEALLIDADQTDAPPLLRTWELPELAVVMGASCRIAEAVQVERCRADGVAIARRSSGGGTVLIGTGALNFTVILPIDSAPGRMAVDDVQRWVLGRIAERLRAYGAPVEVLGSGDLAIEGRKCSGSAQRRVKRRFLVHASILYDLPADRIARYLGAPPKRQPAYRAGRPHDAFVTNLPMPRSAILQAIREAWIGPGDALEPPPVPDALLADLLTTKYTDPAWIERF